MLRAQLERWLQRQWYRVGAWHLVLLPLAWLFGALAGLRRALYRAGVFKAVRLPVPVVVIGNISVGGTGKTPLTLWLAVKLKTRGLHPGIVLRGHGATIAAPRAVKPEDDARVVGDEPVLLARRSGCPVWVAPVRVAAARALLARHPDCDLILADDGLQHYALARTVEIAVVDGVRGFGNGWLLPAGPLRESPRRLDSVDAVVMHGSASLPITPPGPARYSMALTGRTFFNLVDPARSADASQFVGRRVHAVAGIGHPERFFAHLRALGMDFAAHPFADHHPFEAHDLAFEPDAVILMTEKDAVKCFAIADARCWALRVDAQLDPALDEFVLSRIR